VCICQQRTWPRHIVINGRLRQNFKLKHSGYWPLEGWRHVWSHCSSRGYVWETSSL
jgi:hypothetical protein